MSEFDQEVKNTEQEREPQSLVPVVQEEEFNSSLNDEYLGDWKMQAQEYQQKFQDAAGKARDFANEKFAYASDKFKELSNKDPKELPDKLEPEESGKTVPNEVKKLIVELDNAIGAFVNNPIFQNSVKASLKEKAEEDLKQIIRLSAALRQAAERQAQAKN